MNLIIGEDEPRDEIDCRREPTTRPVAHVEIAIFHERNFFKTNCIFLKKTSANFATRATNCKRMMTTSCARTHVFAHVLQVSTGCTP